MSPAALSLACLAWRLKKATHVVIWSWIQYSGGKSQGFCVLTVIGLLKVSALLLFQERGATPPSARWPTQALLCLPWGAQHTVSVTKMRALEMLKRQWVCMAPALGSAWGLEHHNPVAHPHVLRKFSAAELMHEGFLPEWQCGRNWARSTMKASNANISGVSCGII